MRKNPFRGTEFQAKASPELQVAADMALEGLARDPTQEGYFWVKPLMAGNWSGIDLFDRTGKTLMLAQGDLTKLAWHLIPGGSFLCPRGEIFTPFGQSRIQRVPAPARNYAIGRTLVSGFLYQTVMGPIHWTGIEKAKDSVRGISWFDAVLFCNTLSSILGLEPAYTLEGSKKNPLVFCTLTASGFRLPTELEWNYGFRCIRDHSKTWGEGVYCENVFTSTPDYADYSAYAKNPNFGENQAAPSRLVCAVDWEEEGSVIRSGCSPTSSRSGHTLRLCRTLP